MMGQCPLGVHLPAQRKAEAPVPVGRVWELSKPHAGVSREPDYHLQGPGGRECGPSSAAQLLSQSDHRQEALTQALMWVFLSATLSLESPLTPFIKAISLRIGWGC